MPPGEIWPKGDSIEGGPKFKKRPSLAFLHIFWVLIPKIVVVLAENQYLGRLVLRPWREENGI